MGRSQGVPVALVALALFAGLGGPGPFSGTLQSGWSYPPFFFGNVVLAVLMTPLFNNARGSLLWPVLFHWQLINPFWPDAQPHDTWILAAVVALVVGLNRATMFKRPGAVTEVVPGAGEVRP